MYLRTLKLWNFRKYGSNTFEIKEPNLIVPFHKGINVLIGKNDSGKTAILDAIKIVLKTHAYEWIKVEDEDFYLGSDKFRIELEFSDLQVNEAKNFIEWLGWEKQKEKDVPILRLIYQVEIKDGKIQPSDVKAGMDDIGYSLNAEAREYLKTTYLKALRDAENDLIAKKNSRLSQILQEHKLFKMPKGEHVLEKKLDEFNTVIKNWFDDITLYDTDKSVKKEIKDKIDDFIRKFIDESYVSTFNIGEAEIKNILEKLSLGLKDNYNLGLGTLNRLYMAAELLHLKREWNGLKLCMIEELEAHLHPQAQMKVVEALQDEKEVQFILTTHSPNLASKIEVENLLLCDDNNVYSLEKGLTYLDQVKDYDYLKRFLDVTKSNLFFAKGVIIVEGWAEEILLPEIANSIGCNLTKHEVSIVNVGSTAYLHFVKIFLRKDNKIPNIKVAIVTDLDVRPKKDTNEFNQQEVENKKRKIERNIGTLNENVILEIAPEWTLEWCLYKSESLSELFKESVSVVHSRTMSFKKDEHENWNENFEKALISKLKKGEGDSPLDKVAIANTLAEKISSQKPSIMEGDEYLKYIIKAIKHTCNV